MFGNLRSSALWHLENKCLWGFLFLHHNSQDSVGGASPAANKQTDSLPSSSPRFAMALFSHKTPSPWSIPFCHGWSFFRAQWNDPQVFHIESLTQNPFWILRCHLTWSYPPSPDGTSWNAWQTVKPPLPCTHSALPTTLTERLWNPVSTQGVSEKCRYPVCGACVWGLWEGRRQFCIFLISVLLILIRP